MDAPLLRLDSVSKTHSRGTELVHALTDVSLRVDSGEMVAIQAPSGSGKTSLLNIIGALDRPTAGSVHFAGEDITDLDNRRQALFRRTSVGFVFQAFNLIPTLSAWENIAVPLLLNGAPPAVTRTAAQQLLARVKLSDRADHRPAELSGGQIQRVAVARALVMNPALVIADEPTGNLDSAAGRAIIELLVTVAAADGRAVILATHDDRAADASSRRIILSDGKIHRDTGGI